ncbi:ATP-binding protein [Streptomyces sp. NPDC057623]|uniref:ATP-binding protein n=1 Tax=Streptomyces sp. NPDC057623 TaxID=3346187 RepID=UPI00369CB2B2
MPAAPAGALKAATADALTGLVPDRAAPLGFEVDFLPFEHCAGQMRRITRAQLDGWDLTTLADDATLAVSELVTNAVRYGKGRPVGLRVRCSAGELRIEVTDGSPTPARMRSADAADEDGRGLLLVAAVSKEWGVSSDGTMTWCSITIPEGGS